jgi:putative transposase
MVQHRRSFVPGGSFFFTLTLADRSSSRLTDRIGALGAAFRKCRAAHPFETLAIVVLPEHLHCVWLLPEGDADYPTRWGLIKRAFTRRQYREGPVPVGAAPRIWQPRFWEHTVGDDADLQRHVDYIHYNPVKHGYAGRAAEWPHSSFHRYVKRGWLTEDWGVDPGAEGGNFGE